jgi:folate-dependent phosphoribosylglycinamide formyltransferase PurN
MTHSFHPTEASLQVVVSDLPKCGGWQFARQEGIPTEAFPASAKTAEEGKCIALSTEELVEALTERYDVDYVLLAGYLKVMTEKLCAESPSETC